MRTIWKVGFPIGDLELEWDLPRGAVPIHVEEQFGRPTVWYHIPDDEAPQEKRRLVLTGTGKPVPEASEGKLLAYVGTSKHQGGHIMLHVFEER